MKCQNCGAELENGVLFCRECGSKVEKQVCFCRECGAKIEGKSKFCSNCGAKVELQAAPVEPVQTKSDADGAPAVEPVVEKNHTPDTKTAAKQKDSLGDKLKEKISVLWSKLSLYGKVTTVTIGIFSLMCLVAILAGKTAAIVISFVQIAMAVVSILMHKGIIKLEQKKLWFKWLVLVVAVLFAVLNVMSYSWGANEPSTGEDPPSNTNSGSKVEQINWKNITLSAVLPEPQSNMMDLLYNGDDWLNVTIHDISENDYLEYVRWCKEDYGFTVDSDSFDGYFYAYNQDGYCITLFYTETSKELSIDLTAPAGNATENPNDSTEIQQPEQTDHPEQTEPTQADTSDILSIAKGTEYAYMTDEWNVYIARAISDSIIKIENWDKTMSNEKSVSYEYDVGTFKINDSENGFAWVDEEHTAFIITFTDKNNSRFKRGATATFTINTSDSDKNKGSNYSDKIACYSFQNDDWHLYRAIPLTETLIKIETWYRGSSAGTFLFGYDLCLIDTASGETDFEWTDDEHTSFSITMRDEQNKSYWKKDTFVVFELENEEYKYANVTSYLGIWEVGEGEVAVPESASTFKYDDYRDVEKQLTDAGFTNITTEILYDIVWGWTAEGEVDSVSIDGRTDYEKGEVFKRDAPIVITYHMKEEDDPNKPTETQTPEITLTMGEDDFKGMNYKEAEKIFREMGFTSFEYRTVDTENESATDTICYIEITEFFVGNSDFNKGDKFDADSTVTFFSYKYEAPAAPSPVFYSTNDYETAKNGNTGVFSYIDRGGSYDIYWIIDFDEGYVYYFTDGNGETFCDRLKIDSGTLNDAITITYHDGGDTWSYKLHFKYVNHPETLIMVDQNGFEWEYSTTDLDDALELRDSKNIKDY